MLGVHTVCSFANNNVSSCSFDTVNMTTQIKRSIATIQSVLRKKQNTTCHHSIFYNPL